MTCWASRISDAVRVSIGGPGELLKIECNVLNAVLAHSAPFEPLEVQDVQVLGVDGAVPFDVQAAYLAPARTGPGIPCDH
jgi:hypothetical protein